jgi:NTE family protein
MIRTIHPVGRHELRGVPAQGVVKGKALMTENEPHEQRRRVVVACQGGGSQTAFTAGVLTELLADPTLEIRALSGTSGGAVCALLAWYGLLTRRPEDGIRRLEDFWEDNTTHGFYENLLQAVTVASVRTVAELGITVEFSPYNIPFDARRQFLQLLERHVPFDEIHPDELDPSGPRLLVGATDVLSGRFRVFRSHVVNGYPADRITGTVILASSAVPTLFRAVRVGEDVYWDGVYAQNPPIRELVDAGRPAAAQGAAGPPPEELWVIQIDPDQRSGVPMAVDAIRDRRTELSANISYQQEIFTIGHVNKLIQERLLTGRALARYRPIKVRVITMSEAVASGLDWESKLVRSPGFIHRLFAHGKERARLFRHLLDSPDADEATALRDRNIWGQWTAPVPPYLG